MNYAPVVFVGFALISVIWYIIRGGKEFTGPPVPADVEPEHDGEVVGGIGRVVTEREKASTESSSGKNEPAASKFH
jgi:hypothetical protein